MFGCVNKMIKIRMYIENAAFMALVVKGKNGRIIKVVGYNEKRQRERVIRGDLVRRLIKP